MASRIQMLIPLMIITLLLVGVGYMVDSLPDASDKLVLPKQSDTNTADYYHVVYNTYIQE